MGKDKEGLFCLECGNTVDWPGGEWCICAEWNRWIMWLPEWEVWTSTDPGEFGLPKNWRPVPMKYTVKVADMNHHGS
jgi:hypothetical protein